MGTERSGMCLLAEGAIDCMLLLLQTLKVVQIHALLFEQTLLSYMEVLRVVGFLLHVVCLFTPTTVHCF